MYPHRPIHLIFILTLCALLAACTPPPAASQPSATLPTTATDLPPTTTPIPPTLTSAPTLAPAPTLPAPATAAPASAPFKGLLVYNRAQESMAGTNFGGATIKLQFKVPGASPIGEMTAQWANNAVFYLKTAEKAVYQVPVNTAAQKLAFIPAKDSLRFLISPDGKQIAWSFMTYTTPNPTSELWVANLDGSSAKRIVLLAAAANPKMLSLKPLRWLADGRLVYAEEPSGIGGYILFSGFASMRIFDLNSNRAADLTPALGAGGLCLEEISPDLATLLSTCTGSDRSTLAFVTLATQKTLAITRQAEQNQVGSPVFSPSGAWLAYAYARGDVEAEQGSVAVVQTGATTPRILGTVMNGYFNIKAWINENQFIVQRYEGDAASIWLFTRDNVTPVKLADGEFISLIRN